MRRLAPYRQPPICLPAHLSDLCDLCVSLSYPGNG
jgi:hypothetical protein